MRANWKTWLTRASWLALAAMAVANSGCLLAVAGVAAGGTATYLYLDAPVDRTYPADVAVVRNATLAALQDLNMPVVNEEQANSGKDIVLSRASDNEKVKIRITSIPSRVPGEQSITQVTVRVAIFGDKDFSERILNQIGAHLAYGAGPIPVPTPAPPPTVVPTGWQASGQGPTSVVAPPVPQPPETHEPPK
jgi:hypothetical protein